MPEKAENCEGPCFGSSGYIKLIPACMATENGSKNAIGWECAVCPEDVRAAVAARLIEITARNTDENLIHQTTNQEQ